MSIIADIVLTNENEDRGYIFSEFSEEFEDETPGEIFRAMRSEFGRCQSSVYVDQKDGPPKRVGWFFISRQNYDDYHSTDTYLRGAWVTLRREVAPEIPANYERVAV
jgi:hypothetical protein